MQLVWNDVLKKKPWVLAMIKIYFSAMQSMHCGKASTHFFEKASELENIVLTNKAYQSTRFVRSLQRGNTAALRNLPTIVSIISEEYQDNLDNFNNTKAKELKKTLDSLKSAENLFFSIGLAQLLESYCVASLESQYASHFPIQVWQRIESSKNELQNLADDWKWNDTKLKLAGIGTPQILISSVLRKGSYEPYVSEGSIRKNQSKIKDFSELLANKDNNGLFDEENQQVLELAGSVQINNANDETLRKVEMKLQEIAQELKNRWNIRITKTRLQEATIRAFGKIHPENSLESMIEHLEDIISSLPFQQSELFEAQSCYPGFLSWNNFWKKCFMRENVANLDALANVHIYYQNWVKESNSEENIAFQKLWEIVMIRSTSEAICETVGSMMNQHGGKNRHLEPQYFNMEMVLRFNLGPLHLMDNLIDEVLKIDPGKSYIRKETNISQIVSKDINKSAAIATFEKNDEKKSRFPFSFWI